MSDWAPQIVKIEKVIAHPNADALDLVTVLGDYPIVVKRGEYKVGDLTCYVPIDSIVPDTEQYYFLCPKAYEKYEDENGVIQQRQVGPKYAVGSVPEKYRIVKAKRIRNVYSQGMLVQLPKLIGTIRSVGDSVVDILELKKWEEEVDDAIVNVKLRGANAAAPPKGWSIPYYDLESIRKYISLVENEQDIILTEKLNGSNASYVFDGNDLWIKSRNFYKKWDEDDMWVGIAIRCSLKEKLSNYPMMVFFGEVVNQVKKFRYNDKIINGELPTDFYCFDIYDVINNKFLDYDDFASICKKLEVSTTPILYRGPWTSKEKIYQYAEGKSTLNEKIVREGFVLSVAKERFEPKLNGRLKLKLVGECYNLQK